MEEKIIIRKKYIERINRFREQPVIKVITGQRRCGKSFVLKAFIKVLKKNKVPAGNIIYINKEDLKFDSINTYKELAEYVNNAAKRAVKKSKIYLIIDEVQEISGFEKAVRSFALQDKYDIYISGSNSTIVSSELAAYLSGRYINIYVSPLDYSEFLMFSGAEDSAGSLNKYIRYGGLPFIHHSPLRDDLVFTYTRNVYNTILLKDVVKKFEIRNVGLLEKLVSFLCNNIGHVFSANSISKFLKNEGINVSASVILDYLKALSAAYFIHEAKRYDLKGKKIFKLNSKFYINDIGIRNSLAGFNESTLNQLIENIVYLHLLSYEYEVFTGIWGSREIDFVAVKNNQVKYVQVALTVLNKNTHEREFGNLLKVNDNYEKIVVTLDKLAKGFKGIKQLTLNDFLMNFK